MEYDAMEKGAISINRIIAIDRVRFGLYLNVDTICTCYFKIVLILTLFSDL